MGDILSGIQDPALREAAGLDPAMGTSLVASEALFQSLPVYQTDFNSPIFPEMNGAVEIRFGTVGDAIRIERICGGALGGFLAEAIASLQVLIQKAPASWYLPSTQPGEPPALNLTRLPDIEALADLYRAYSKWRGDFRRQSGGNGLAVP